MLQEKEDARRWECGVEFNRKQARGPLAVRANTRKQARDPGCVSTQAVSTAHPTTFERLRRPGATFTCADCMAPCWPGRFPGAPPPTPSGAASDANEVSTTACTPTGPCYGQLDLCWARIAGAVVGPRGSGEEEENTSPAACRAKVWPHTLSFLQFFACWTRSTRPTLGEAYFNTGV
jgi:hypothetical protein